jgi:hypothetical protein
VAGGALREGASPAVRSVAELSMALRDPTSADQDAEAVHSPTYSVRENTERKWVLTPMSGALRWATIQTR